MTQVCNPSIGKLRQEDSDFEASLAPQQVPARLGYTVRPCLRKKKKERISIFD
jgi:hypothetical protein